MQLDNILSAAVAAVNDVQQVPSPDVPQYSPTPPSSALQEQQGSVTPFTIPPLKRELSGPEKATQLERCDDDYKVIPFLPAGSTLTTEETSPSSKGAFHVYNEALQDVQDGEGCFGDISFFTLDDDNLVITSQQALEMFESKPDEVARPYEPYDFKSDARRNNRLEINTPPIDHVENALRSTSSVPIQEPQPLQHLEAPIAEPVAPTPIGNENGVEIADGEVPNITDVVLDQWPDYMEGAMPVNNALQVTEVTEMNGDVPLISSEVEVLTTLEAPQYTSLTPAVTQAMDNSHISSVTEQVLQSLPGSTLDATVDANGRFVVQVVAPGMNMTVQNEYIGREEEVVSETVPLDQQIQIPSSTQVQNHQLHHPPISTNPYETAYDERVNLQRQAVKDVPLTKEDAPRQEKKSRSSVLTALRDSIYRSRAKKRQAEEQGKHSEESPAKKKPADILNGIQMEYDIHSSRHATQEEHHHPQRHEAQRNQGQHPIPHMTRQPPHAQYHSKESRVPTRTNEMMVLRPDELQAALKQRGRQGSSSPLVVIRPDDLHAEGGDGKGEPLQVQLVYLVYPMDNSGDSGGGQDKTMPCEMIPFNHLGFPRDIPNLQPPTASTKKFSLFHDVDSGPPTVNQGSHPKNNHNSLNSLNRDSLDYIEKPIRQWSYQDVICYVFHTLGKEWKLDQLNYAALSGTTGNDLCEMTIADFMRFAPTNGEDLYRHFRQRLDEEERSQIAARAAASSHENQNRRIKMEQHAQYEFINHPTTFYNPPPPQAHPVKPSPSVLLREATVCDAPAAYELHYKTIDARSIGLDNGSVGILPEGPSSASGKTYAPLHNPSAAMPFDIDGNMSDPDQSSAEEEVKPPEPPKKRGPGRPRKPENELKKKKKKTGRLWEFIRNLLLDPETCPSMVRWENSEEGVFRFVQAEKVAQRWGERKQNHEMNYEKLSRAMRYYYKGEVFEAVLGRRLVYKFGKNAKGWRTNNPNFQNPVVPYPHTSTH